MGGRGGRVGERKRDFGRAPVLESAVYTVEGERYREAWDAI